MSLDRSLRSLDTLVRHRNVLTRAERILRLQRDGRWKPEDGVFGLPKVAHRKLAVGGKSKKPAKAAETPAAGTGT